MKRAQTRAKSRIAGPSSGKRRASRVPPGEYIRVVPLHDPRAVAPTAEIVRRRAAEERDFFNGRPVPPPAKARLTYRGGPLLSHAEVFTIFWGKTWGATPGSTALMERLNGFFADILVSSLIDRLSEYNVPGQSIGHGSFIGTDVISAAAPLESVMDSELQAELRKWLKAGLVPKQTKNTLYFVYLEPGIASIMGGGRSCRNYCGYHSNIGRTYYAVMPYPACDGCLGGLSVFDALTGTSSHELCEAITDPVPGLGWYDDVNGEIGDICSWAFKQVAGYTVQLEWSNLEDGCV